MLTGTLEQLVNRGLPRSVRARALCAELAGRSLAVEIPGLTRLRVTSNGVTLGIARSDVPADTTLTGGVLALWGLAGDSPQAVVQRGDVVISGDTHLAEQFRELGRLLRPDPEEELALLIGDVAAHRLGRVARAALRLPRRAAGTAFAESCRVPGPRARRPGAAARRRAVPARRRHAARGHRSRGCTARAAGAAARRTVTRVATR